MDIDAIRLHFSPSGLVVLNGVLAMVMFGVALDLRWQDLREVGRAPQAVLLGLGAQFLLLPAATFALVNWLEPLPSMALGMFLVAACPGGNLSNFLTQMAGGNTALSVMMSAISTCAAVLLTPLNFAFWAGLYPPTAKILQEVAVSPQEAFLVVATILGLPVAAGMLTAARFPAFAERARGPMRKLSLAAFAAFVAVAFAANFQHFVHFVHRVAALVLLHNALALLIGRLTGYLAKLKDKDQRAVTIEIGIQNSGLGLVLIFNFFAGLGGMAIIAAWWGIWHILAGMALAFFWSQRPIQNAEGRA